MQINHLLHFSLFQLFFIILSVVTIVVFVDKDFTKDLFVRKKLAEEEKVWILLGGLKSDEVTFRIRHPPMTEDDEISDQPFSFYVAKTSDFSNAVVVYRSSIDFQSSEDTFVTSITVPDLEPDQSYIYGFAGKDVPKYGSFQTPGHEGMRYNFTVAVSGCALTGSNTKVFQHVIDDNDTSKAPLLFLHAGDFHYEDLATTNLEERIVAIDKVMESPSQRYLFANTALVYMWDDHDWLGDNSLGYIAEVGARETALLSYEVAFPQYEPRPASLPQANFSDSTSSTSVSPYHAFTIGTVRFIVTDLRSESTPTQIYSDEQRSWFYDELSNSTAYDYVVWLNTKPWIGPEDDGDSWRAYPTERADLSNHISKVVEKENLLVVSADAHMVAFDDGSNTYYGSEEPDDFDEKNQPSFPLLHSGPLDKLGSVKGGPYSHGCNAVKYERNHQYSTISFEFPHPSNTTSEDSSTTCLRIKSYSVQDSPIEKKVTLLLSEEICGKLFRGNEKSSTSDSSLALSDGASCTLNHFSPFTTILLYSGIGLFVVTLILIFFRRSIIAKADNASDSCICKSNVITVTAVYLFFAILMLATAASPLILRVKALEPAMAFTFLICQGIATFFYVWFW